jgi:hypothetical protein
MAAYAAVANRIKDCSGIINNVSHNIDLLAATILSLDNLAQARIFCGIRA